MIEKIYFTFLWKGQILLTIIIPVKNKKTLAFIALIAIVILWGVVPVIGKYLLENQLDSPSLLIAVRGLVASVVMFIFILITKAYKQFNKSYLICIPAGLILASAYIFQFIGLDQTSASKSTFLESFSVIATPISLFLMVRERPKWNAIVASLLCLVGAFILCGDGWNFSELLKVPSMGDIFSSIGGALFGVNIAFTQVFAKDKNPFLYVTIQLSVLTIASFIYAFLFEHPLLFVFEPINILLVLFLSIFCTAICWIVRAISVNYVSGVTIAVFNPMSAVIATIIALCIGQERFNFNLFVGGIIIVTSILISSLFHKEKEPKRALKILVNQL